MFISLSFHTISLLYLSPYISISILLLAILFRPWLQCTVFLFYCNLFYYYFLLAGMHSGPVILELICHGAVWLHGVLSEFTWARSEYWWDRFEGCWLCGVVRQHCDVMVWKIFPYYWPFYRECSGHGSIPRTKGQIYAALFSVLLDWTHCWKHCHSVHSFRSHNAHVTSLYFIEKNSRKIQICFIVCFIVMPYRIRIHLHPTLLLHWHLLLECH